MLFLFSVSGGNGLPYAAETALNQMYREVTVVFSSEAARSRISETC